MPGTRSRREQNKRTDPLSRTARVCTTTHLSRTARPAPLRDARRRSSPSSCGTAPGPQHRGSSTLLWLISQTAERYIVHMVSLYNIKDFTSQSSSRSVTAILVLRRAPGRGAVQQAPAAPCSGAAAPTCSQLVRYSIEEKEENGPVCTHMCMHMCMHMLAVAPLS